MAETRKRKPKYEVGREEALNEALTILSMAVDAHPKPISPETLALITSDADLAERIAEQLKRFRLAVAADLRRGKGVEAISA